jgi:hypothetical protein
MRQEDVIARILKDGVQRKENIQIILGDIDLFFGDLFDDVDWKTADNLNGTLLLARRRFTDRSQS